MICKICNRDLPEEFFYPSEFRGNRKPRCKGCHKAMKKSRATLKGDIVKVGERLYVSKRGFYGIFWTPNMISILKRHYPNSPNSEVCEMLGVSERTLVRKARELGLEKSEEYISNNAKVKSLMGIITQRKNKQQYGRNQ